LDSRIAGKVRSWVRKRLHNTQQWEVIMDVLVAAVEYGAHAAHATGDGHCGLALRTGVCARYGHSVPFVRSARSLPLYGELGSVDHGRGYSQFQRTTKLQRLQRGQSSVRKRSSGGTASAGDRAYSDSGIAQAKPGTSSRDRVRLSCILCSPFATTQPRKFARCGRGNR
jgi:hypothetical protein